MRIWTLERLFRGDRLAPALAGAAGNHRHPGLVSCRVNKCALDARNFWLLARRDNALWQAPHKAEQRSQESKGPVDHVVLFAGQDTRWRARGA